jgi:hypothetical protein
MTLTDSNNSRTLSFYKREFYQRPQAHVLANSNNQIMNTQRVRHTDCSYPFKPMALTHTDLFLVHWRTAKQEWIRIQLISKTTKIVFHFYHTSSDRATSWCFGLDKYWSPRIPPFMNNPNVRLEAETPKIQEWKAGSRTQIECSLL